MKFIVFNFLFLSILTAHPFDYDLHFTELPGKDEKTLICFHGYGSNYRIAEKVQKGGVESTIISFNFPDHDILKKKLVSIPSFGSIRELLPAFYVLKEVVLERDLEEVDLYGFSAGGGALINLIGILNGSKYDQDLLEIGIGKEEKSRLLSAISNGSIFLDAPLKSIEEIIDFKGTSFELEMVAKSYRENGLRPIDSLNNFQGLSLNIHLYFQKNDEILSNRDDRIFIERLLLANQMGDTLVTIADEGGHTGLHHLLWEYENKISTY